jgi:hypothetical protein
MHPTELQLPRLVVKHSHILDMRSSEFDEVLVRRVLMHVVVSVFFALELYDKAM